MVDCNYHLCCLLVVPGLVRVAEASILMSLCSIGTQNCITCSDHFFACGLAFCIGHFRSP